MIFVPASKGGAADSTSANGTLYVVQCDVYNMSGKVYRFDVNGTNITLINNVDSVPQFADFAKFRSAFVTDGSVAIMTQPNFVGNTDLMSISPISGAKNGSSGLVNSEQGLTTSLNDHPTASSNINDDITLADSRISEVARNSASGAWIIPSTQGVRVNQ
jgi:hypothetical protein